MSKPEPTIRSLATSFDRCKLTLIWMPNDEDVRIERRLRDDRRVSWRRRFIVGRRRPSGRRSFATSRDFKIHYGELLLRQLRPWGTRLTTPFPPQTSNRLRFRCTATGCSASTCLNKNGCVRLYSSFIRQRLDQWQWFSSLVSILRLPEIRFVSQLLLQRPASTATWIPTTKQNNADKKLNFSSGRVFVICDKSENTKLSIRIKYILRSSA